MLQNYEGNSCRLELRFKHITSNYEVSDLIINLLGKDATFKVLHEVPCWRIDYLRYQS